MRKMSWILVVVMLMLMAGVAFAGPIAAKRPRAAGAAPRPLIFTPDAYEPDNATDTAKFEYGTSIHTIAYADSGEGLDRDWVKFTADATGQPFILQSTYRDGYLDMWMDVYEPNPDGTMHLLDHEDDMRWFKGYGSEDFFVAPYPGTFYIDNYARTSNWGTYSLFVAQGLAKRVAGADRFATCVEISKAMWPDTMNADYQWGPENIIVANPDSVDALVGGAFGSSFEYDFDAAPLLLTTRDSMPAAIKSELARLAHGAPNDGCKCTVWVLGGPDKVSDAQLHMIEDIPFVYEVKRVAGANRYATAAAVASATVDMGDMGNTAYLVNSNGVADALAAAPLMQENGGALLFTGSAHLSNETSQWLADHPGIPNVVVVGGEDKVSPTVVTELEGMGLTVDRIAGANRYETAALLSRYAKDTLDIGGDGFVLASGEKYPDALCAGPMAGMLEAPLLLTRGASLDSTVTSFYNYYGTSGASYVLGGTSTISATAFNQLNGLWNQP